jgi:hypothetical protein
MGMGNQLTGEINIIEAFVATDWERVAAQRTYTRSGCLHTLSFLAVVAQLGTAIFRCREQIRVALNPKNLPIELDARCAMRDVEDQLPPVEYAGAGLLQTVGNLVHEVINPPTSMGISFVPLFLFPQFLLPLEPFHNRRCRHLPPWSLQNYTKSV